MATYDLTASIPSSVRDGDVLNCPYSGEVVAITLPRGVFKLEVWGAQGGYRSSASYAGKGGYAVGTLTLEEPTEIFLRAGGSGNSVTTKVSTIYPGGFNGGGYRYNYKGGGGASDIRIGQDSLYARVIVAGGGGSDGAKNKTGMYGGGTSGGASTQSYGSYGYGGTQTGHTTSVTMPSSQPTTNSASNYPGGFGFGGFGINRSGGFGGAGGGGWYGGCGAYPDSSGDDDRGGGGGSGYIYTADTAVNYPSGCLLDATHYLADASMVAGNASFTDYDGTTVTGHSGDGACRITVISSGPEPPTDLTCKVLDKVAHLSWSASPTSEVTGYKIYRDGVLVGETLGDLEFSDSVSPSTEYTYSVTADISGSESDPISVVVYYELPQPPTDLQASVSPGLVDLTWGKSPSEVSGYKIYQNGVLMATTPWGKPLFEFPFANESLSESLLVMSEIRTDTFSQAIKPFTEYVYSVTAYAPEGESETVSITVYYETYLQITGITLLPNPVDAGTSLSVEADILETIEATIT